METRRTSVPDRIDTGVLDSDTIIYLIVLFTIIYYKQWVVKVSKDVRKSILPIGAVGKFLHDTWEKYRKGNRKDSINKTRERIKDE